MTTTTNGVAQRYATGAISRMKSKSRLAWTSPPIMFGVADHEQRIAVGRGAHDGLGRKNGAGAGLVLRDELLAEVIGQILADQASADVGRTSCRVADDQTHRTIGIIERRRDARGERNCSSPGDGTQCLTAMKRHDDPPPIRFEHFPSKNYTDLNVSSNGIVRTRGRTRRVQNPFTTCVTCSTSGGEAKQ